MKIYLDSAQRADWALPSSCPSVCGVTTNPTLIRKAALPVTLPSCLDLLHAAADHGFAELMLQLPSPDIDQARAWHAALHAKASALNVTLTIKIPCHSDWLPCIHVMQAAHQPFLLTGLANPVQLLWARSLGATYVAPYIGRLAADGRDVWTLVRACVAIQADGPALLAASIKSADVLANLIASGAAAVTLAPEHLANWSHDGLTQAAIEQFERDTAESLNRAQP